MELVPSLALQPGLGIIKQQLMFTPSESMECVEFPLDDDDIALEPNETLNFNLTRVTLKSWVAISSPNMTTVIITDDDSMYFTLQ